MEIAFVPDKHATNRAKHGVSLALGLVVLENPVGEIVDDRRDYGEVWMNAFGLVEGRRFACTFTLRGDVRRVISVRKASRREQQTWLR